MSGFLVFICLGQRISHLSFDDSSQFSLQWIKLNRYGAHAWGTSLQLLPGVATSKPGDLCSYLCVSTHSIDLL